MHSSGLVLGGIDLLDRRGMDNHIDPFACPAQTVAVAHVADEEAQLRVTLARIFLFQFKLLQLIARVYHNPLDLRITLKYCFYEFFAE